MDQQGHRGNRPSDHRADDRDQNQGLRGNQHADLPTGMDRMNIGNTQGRGNMYSQHGNQNARNRSQRPISGNNLAEVAGSAHYPRVPIPKKNLEHTTQEFAKRPEGSVFEKKNIGTKCELLTNHALVHLPETTIQLFSYNIDIFKRNKPVTKREEAGPIFWDIVRSNRPKFPGNQYFIYNDMNMLWSTTKLPHGEASVSGFRNQNHLVYKFTGTVDFGKEIREDQDKQLLSTLIDAIATARVRSGSKKYRVFKRCMFVIQDFEENPEDVLGHPLTVTLRHGMDARIGVSIAVKVNLRAGITACYDVAHTMFTRSGYPIIRLLCELINNEPISDEDFEDKWDGELKAARVTERNRELMTKILSKMRLRHSRETGIVVGQNGEDVRVPRLSHFTSGNGKEFKFEKVTDRTAAEFTFVDTRNNKQWTVATYYLAAYNIRLRYPNLPCIQQKSTRGAVIAYPMELVSFVEEPKRFTGDISKRAKVDLATYTEYNAPQRRAVIQRFIGQQGIADVPPAVNNDDFFMKHHNLTIEKNMLSVEATVLPAPTVIYGEGSKFKDVDHTGKWEAITHDPIRKVLEGSIYVRNKDGPKLRKRLLGSILHIESPLNRHSSMEYDSECYHRIMRAVEAAGQPVAWENEEYGQAAIQGACQYRQNFHDPTIIFDFFENLKKTIDDKYKQSEDEVLVPFVLVVFEERFTTLLEREKSFKNDYNFIKYLGDNEQGIYTQGILVANLSVISPNPVTCKLTSLLVEKILGKVGTTHRKLEREGDHKSWTKLTDPKSPTLVLGVDVSHPSPSDRLKHDIHNLSVATVVGNIDLDCTEYRASSRIQEAGEELIVKFQYEVNKRINEFIQSTGKRPAHIVVYRDGISEGDFQRILYEERKNIENACVEMDPAFQPTITYIVVTKRHHTKFFLKNDSEGNEEQGFNVLPGTLVEDAVTTKDYYDFYLTTQLSGKTGLARPTHYYVLYDTWKPRVTFWPTITHALTYMFCRSTSTVALPAPVLYAHLAAKRAKECMGGAWDVAQLRNRHLSIKNYADLNDLTHAINVNNGLDGMTFV